MEITQKFDLDIPRGGSKINIHTVKETNMSTESKLKIMIAQLYDEGEIAVKNQTKI